MHLHILGICGTFMGGIAAIAKAAGHRVTGCDANVYPPMSTQLEALGIALDHGFAAEELDGNAGRADVFVIGNVISRGNPLMEAILDAGRPYVSGPQWLYDNVLRDKWVLAVAGTHGKTTTSSLLAFILDQAGLDPGFMIGGIAHDFGISARLTASSFFVVEADEYDTAFFDKRSKFVHYRPRTAVLNNLEFDHADIFPDVAAIETQFHHLVRTVPRSGRLIVNGDDENLARVLARGCWSELEFVATGDGSPESHSSASSAHWTLARNGEVRLNGVAQGRLALRLPGRHNAHNALAALAAARHVGVAPAQSLLALARFQGIRRRLELYGSVDGVAVYDDFAHHPTAIAATLAALRQEVDAARIIAVIEPRSNTMKEGVMKAALPVSLTAADRVFCYAGALRWDAAATLSPLGAVVRVMHDFDAMIEALAHEARAGDHIVVMSNGGFGGIHDKLLAALAQRAAATTNPSDPMRNGSTKSGAAQDNGAIDDARPCSRSE